MSVISFNPFSWYQNLSNKGVFLDTDPISDGTSITPISFTAKEFGDLTEQQSQEKVAIVNKFYSVINTRKELLKALTDLKKIPMTQKIIDCYLNEGFYSNNNLDIVEVDYLPEDGKDVIQEEINQFLSKKNIQQVLVNLLPYLMLLGDCYLTPKPDPEFQEGLLEILDNAVVEDILPVYRGTECVQFFKISNNPSKPVEEYDKDAYVHFSIPGEQIKVRLDYVTDGKKITYNLPEYIYMGKSIFINSIDLLRRLEMLDLANIALALRQILSPMMISVGVPANSSIQDTIKLTKHFENHIENILTDIGNPQQLNIQQILMMASKIRAIPQYSDGKQSTSSINFANEKAPNYEQINQLELKVASSTNTPPFLVTSNGMQTNIDRPMMLKSYGAFTKKINEMQFALKKGVKQLIIMHLKHLKGGINVKPHELSVKFKQVINVDTLETLDLLVGTAISVQQIYSAATNIAQDPNTPIGLNVETLLSVLNGAFNSIPGIKDLFIKLKEEEAAATDSLGNFNTGNNSKDDLKKALEYIKSMGDPNAKTGKEQDKSDGKQEDAETEKNEDFNFNKPR